MRTYKGTIVALEPNQVFVFGSNTQGRHGKGAAKWAKDNAGAVYGHSMGLMGQSYGIITKDLTKSSHPSIDDRAIIYQIEELYYLAKLTKDKEYLVAYSGTGVNLNGYSNSSMANMFVLAGPIPDNIVFEESFSILINGLSH